MKKLGPPAGPVAAGGVVLTDEQRLAWLRLTRSENVEVDGRFGGLALAWQAVALLAVRDRRLSSRHAALLRVVQQVGAGDVVMMAEHR